MSAASTEPGTTVIALKGVRGMIAQRMMKSAQSTARVTLHADCDASGLGRARAGFKARGSAVSYDDLLLYALARTLQRHGGLNGTTTEQEIRLSATVNVGVAVALQGALIVPTLFGVERKSIREIAAQRVELIARARGGKLSTTDMTGATFTVSNIGVHGVRYFTPVINAPQIAILGVGEIAPRAWVDTAGELCVRPILGLSLSFDHRALDGVPAAAFLKDLIGELERLGVDASSVD